MFVYACMHVLWKTCGGQRVTFRSFLTMWGSGIELRHKIRNNVWSLIVIYEILKIRFGSLNVASCFPPVWNNVWLYSQDRMWIHDPLSLLHAPPCADSSLCFPVLLPFCFWNKVTHPRLCPQTLCVIENNAPHALMSLGLKLRASQMVGKYGLVSSWACIR